MMIFVVIGNFMAFSIINFNCVITVHVQQLKPVFRAIFHFIIFTYLRGFVEKTRKKKENSLIE